MFTKNVTIFFKKITVQIRIFPFLFSLFIMKKETSDLLLNPVVRKQQVNQARTLIENFSLVKSGSHLEKALSSEAEKF